MSPPLPAWVVVANVRAVTVRGDGHLPRSKQDRVSARWQHESIERVLG